MRFSVFFFFLFIVISSLGQCTLTDGTSCACENGGSDCDLLPDITISWEALDNFLGGPNEYSQTGNGINDGRLKFSASTPNIGYGPLTVHGTNLFVCGTDTVVGDPGICPDGSAPKQLITQRIYHRNSNGTISYTDRYAGAMLFHPTHNHNHVDEWGVFSLRLEDPTEPDPRKWPIVGNGTKVGFCLMDYGTCTSYAGHCKDDNTIHNAGNTMLNSAFPNYGLGGGTYNCSVIEMGISVGFTDIYSENLDGQWIDIPAGTCNGNYYIVAEIDPKHHFLESDTTNNYTAVPITLINQDTPGNPNFVIQSDQGIEVCDGNTANLTAPAGFNYLWNTGDTTQTISTTAGGTYDVTLTNHCGTGTSAPITITVLPTPVAPSVSGDTLVCMGQSAQLTANTNDIKWYDNNNFNVGTGQSFTTPSLNAPRTYYAEALNLMPGISRSVGLIDTTTAAGGFFNGSQSMIFDVLEPCRIKSFKVYANGAGNRDFQLNDVSGSLIMGGTYFLPNGESVVEVNYDVPIGVNYLMTVSTPSPNLYRSNTNVSYPYSVQDTIIIQSSTGGANFYYYFYDWKIEVGVKECAGPKTAFVVDVEDCTGIDELPSINHLLSINPNPNTGLFSLAINVPGTHGFHYTITDLLGKVVYRENIQKQTGIYNQIIDLSQYGKGMYVVRLQLGAQQVSKKFIID